MKKLIVVFAVLALASCSSSPDTTPGESEASVLPAESSAPSDPLMAEGDALPAPEGALSTPVEPAPMPEAPAPSEAAAEPTPSEPVSATPPETTAEAAASSSEPMPAPESMPPAMPESAPSEAAKSEAMPPVVAGAGAKTDRNTYQAYKEYQDRVKMRAESEAEIEDRVLFPHEDGAFQLGLDYAYKPFPNYDFDPGRAVKTAESQGGALSFNYFPVRSHSYGRLGLGVQLGAYWSKLRFTNGTTVEDTSRNLINSLGGKLIYEFHYFLGQTIVPHAFFGYDMVRVRDFSLAGVTYPAAKFNAQSYGGGLHFNLNRLESTAASRALVTTGVRKFYLSYTAAAGSENTGLSHYLGLRFEY